MQRFLRCGPLTQPERQKPFVSHKFSFVVEVSLRPELLRILPVIPVVVD
jgi:hypothetical protein